jgi:hypothetical protein
MVVVVSQSLIIGVGITIASLPRHRTIASFKLGAWGERDILGLEAFLSPKVGAGCGSVAGLGPCWTASPAVEAVGVVLLSTVAWIPGIVSVVLYRRWRRRRPRQRS